MTNNDVTTLSKKNANELWILQALGDDIINYCMEAIQTR